MDAQCYHTSKRGKSEYSCEHSNDCTETEDICPPQGHAPFPHPGTCHCRCVKARALTPTQDNSGEQSQLHRLSKGLTEAIIKTPSWPPIMPKPSLCPVLYPSLPSQKMFPGTSLAVQWLRLSLPMQGLGFDF